MVEDGGGWLRHCDAVRGEMIPRPTLLHVFSLTWPRMRDCTRGANRMNLHCLFIASRKRSRVMSVMG